MAPKDILDVEWRAAETLCHFHDIRRRHEQKHRGRIDEATNKPGTCDPVDLRTSAGHPHSSTSRINGRELGHGNQWKLCLPPCFEPTLQHLRWNTPVSEPRRNALTEACAFLTDHDGRLVPGVSVETPSFSKVRWREEGIRYG